MRIFRTGHWAGPDHEAWLVSQSEVFVCGQQWADMPLLECRSSLYGKEDNARKSYKTRTWIGQPIQNAATDYGLKY